MFYYIDKDQIAAVENENQKIISCNPNIPSLFTTGHVYNVSAYMDYHPGGGDELMRGAGKDATQLFDEVHEYQFD